MPGVADVVRRFGSGYLTRYGATMLPSHRRALRDLAACRTATLGGHVSRCDHCGTEHFTYHSCRNRSCPTCHSAATTAWLAARETELLPVPYFHVVFTLPSELRELVRAHQRVLLSLLMTSAAEGLQALAADGHYVGGTVGILAVLHTWTSPPLPRPLRAIPRSGARRRRRDSPSAGVRSARAASCISSPAFPACRPRSWRPASRRDPRSPDRAVRRSPLYSTRPLRPVERPIGSSRTHPT
jgi:hypothetical protein